MVKYAIVITSGDMGISDDSDRLKILQQITSMRADTVTSGSASPVRRIRSPMKGRRFSEIVCPTRHYGSGGGGGGHIYRGSRSPRSGGSSRGSPGGVKQSRYVNIPIQDNVRSQRSSDSGASMISSPTRLSTTDHTSSDSQESSRISTPDKQLQEATLSEVDRRGGLDHLNKLHTVATLRYHNVKRLSRSLDRMFPVSFSSSVRDILVV